MKEIITNKEVQDFLVDFEHNSQTVILEEGKEKNDLILSAKKRGIIINKDDRDLGVIKTIYLFTNEANANKAIVPTKEFVKIFPQIIGRLMDVGHDRQLIVGFYIDYKFILKEKKAIAYAIFFKSAYPELWEKVKKFQKANKLSSSFEIWSPEESRKYKENGDYVLTEMAIAGGALIFEENGDLPAFKDAKVLEIAKTDISTSIAPKSLVFASKLRCKDLIMTGGKVPCSKCGKCKDKMENSDIDTISDVVDVEKITCLNCKEEFSNTSEHEIKCPKCFALVDKRGTVLFPPQIMDFKISCPACQISNWLILSKNAENAKLRCKNCSKEYQISFAIINKGDKLTDKLNFVNTGSIRCHQCNHPIYYSGVSNLPDKEVKCKNCGLEFSFNITEDKYRKINKIEEILKSEKVENEKKSSDKRGRENTMKIPKEVTEKVEAMVKAKKEEEATVEVKPVEEQKVDDKVVVEEAPIEEKPVEEVVEEVKEEVVEEKPEKEPEVVEEKVEKVEEVVEETVEPTPEVKEEVTEEVVEKKVKETPEVKEEVVEEVKESPAEEVVEEKVETPEDVVEESGSKYPKTASLRKAVTKLRDLEKSSVEKTALLVEGIKKTVTSLIALMEASKKAEKENAEKIEFYKANAKKIMERRTELAEEYSKDLSDEDLLNDDKFDKAIAEKENTLLKASMESTDEIVGAERKHDEEFYQKKRDDINEVAFGKSE